MNGTQIFYSICDFWANVLHIDAVAIRRYLKSIHDRLIAYFSKTYSYVELQRIVRTTPMPKIDVIVPGHSHNQAANLRLAADQFITAAFRSAGICEYVISMARRDFQASKRGDRLYHVGKDMQMVAACDDEPKGKFGYTMIDVDYYVDLPYYLGKFRPIGMYTFAPIEPAGKLPNGVYTIEKDQVRVNMCGSAEYQHYLWDYQVDHVVLHGYFRDSLFLVEQRIDPLDETHRIVFFIPVRKVWNWFGLWRLSGPTIERRKISFGSYNKMEFIRQDGDSCDRFLSLSKQGSNAVCTIPEQLAQNIALRVARSKDSIMASVEGTLRTYMGMKTQNFDTFGWKHWANQGDPAIRASVLVDVLENAPQLVSTRVRPASVFFPSMFHYEPVHPTIINNSSKQSLREVVSFDRAFLGTGASPNQCAASDISSVEGRINKPRNPNARVPVRFDKYAAEFCRFVIPDDVVGTGFPVDVSEVMARQDRPSQRKIIDRVKDFLWNKPKGVIASFQKRESYGKVTDPRNISTIEGSIKVRLSRFTYAIYPLMSRQPFYAFSKTPIQLVEAMSNLLQKSELVVPTDFSRFDGTHSRWLADQEHLFFQRYFGPEFHEELEQSLKGVFNCTGYTRYGQKYSSGDSRASGSPDTSLSNTFDNALVGYIALRESSMGPQTAFDNLGLYGGDDGVTPEIRSKVYERVASQLGLGLKAETVLRDHPVPFLGRVYFGTWSVPDSIRCIADVPRQLAKLHATTAPYEVPDWVVLHRKAVGFLLTDSTTPILSQWARAVLRCTKYRDVTLSGFVNQLKQDYRWFEQYENADQFPKCNPDDATHIVAAALGVCGTTVSEICGKLDGLSNTSRIDDLFFRIVEGERQVTISAISGGCFLQPKDAVGLPVLVEKPAGCGKRSKTPPLPKNNSNSSQQPAQFLATTAISTGSSVASETDSGQVPPLKLRKPQSPSSSKSSNPKGPNPRENMGVVCHVPVPQCNSHGVVITTLGDLYAEAGDLSHWAHA